MTLIDDENKKKIADQVYRQGYKLFSTFNRQRKEVGHFPELGLCNHCSSLKSIVTEFGARRAACNNSLINLTGKDKITECTHFWDRTHQGLESLLDMNPLLIDIKETIGF
jgi:hypothetical protein